VELLSQYGDKRLSKELNISKGTVKRWQRELTNTAAAQKTITPRVVPAKKEQSISFIEMIPPWRSTIAAQAIFEHPT
jgi:transposase